jgi:hypothetical protein
MLIYLLIYLCIGALIMAMLRGHYSNRPDLWSEVTSPHCDSEAVDRFISDFIAPLFGAIALLIAWPLLLGFKAWDMWKYRHLQSEIAQRPASPAYDPDRVIWLGRSIKRDAVPFDFSRFQGPRE